MGKKTYLGGSTIIGLGGKWPKTSEATRHAPARFKNDSLQSPIRSESVSGLRVIRRRNFGPANYLGLVVWALAKGKLPPEVPQCATKELATEVRKAGEPESWARRQPRFKIIEAAIAREVRKKSSGKMIAH